MNWSSVNWVAVGTVAGVATSFVLGLIGFLRGSKADQSLHMARMTELALKGQTDLVDQLQEELQRHNEEAAGLRAELMASRLRVTELESRLGTAETAVDNQQAEIIRLKQRLGDMR